ncbi:Transcriptional regulator [Hyella patelloides LEGE 07179]|uniref:Transcriptional regulator n=1 Tax=Hyella patelloides LEGE 07179 TaxID=945734 RepID=A0A563W1J6_9CYAN|nr:helix-turn-helix transcriptional regulator [Hyella patelloides]VEP17540.1 Transcriptional regulator [Hyella patelloides LEGE 07179]
MTMQLALNSWEDWLVPGSPSDPRLLHSENSDRILVYPSHLGQGYRQEILLRDDLSLVVIDYALDRYLTIDPLSTGDCLKFEFRLAGFDAGYSFIIPYCGLRQLSIARHRKRTFEVEVIFKRPTLLFYFQSFMERLSPQTYCIAERVIKSIYRYQEGYCTSSTAVMLKQILQRAKNPDSYLAYEQILTDALYSEAISLDYAACSPITPLMKRVIGEILSCPYQGATRRAYLEQKALKLVTLRLAAMIQPRLNESDLSCIYQAEAILRNQSVNPPTVGMLARQVGTNRFKLNQGFHQVYGTTPFGYLRDFRLIQARKLLMTSDLSIEKVAATVGYTSRSRFATAFRHQFGINPKAFQMQAWRCVS